MQPFKLLTSGGGEDWLCSFKQIWLHMWRWCMYIT